MEYTMTDDELRWLTKADLKWIERAEEWATWIRFSDTEPAPPDYLLMMRGANGNVRCFAKNTEGRYGQFGKEHKSVMAACYWAWGTRWLELEPDGSLDMLVQLACRAEVLAGGTDQGYGPKAKA